jgi:eukaryotic-like serine/threonine-protein kinase
MARGDKSIAHPAKIDVGVGAADEEDETLSADGGAGAVRHRGGLEPGAVFADRYEIQELVGRGGMGTVYRVRDKKLDEIVALKLLRVGTEKAAERFFREVRLARRVTHANVARTHDLGEHEGITFLTMEYVRGSSLDHVLDEHGKLDAKKTIRIGEQIASGLEAAHTAGVIHRDLKPANVLIGEDGRVVLTDFGIARAARVDTHTHETGALVGTPHYMSPEQIAGAPVDSRTDIYSLGIMLYELATGHLPFEAESPLAVAVMRMHQPPVDPRTICDVPDGLAELILRCLAREPDARLQSAGDVRGVLQSLMAGHTSSLRPSEHAFPSGISTPSGRSTPSGMSLYAPMSPGRRALAVLPFVYRGDPAHDYLGEGLAEELIDTLSRTKGLRVLALGATRRFSGDRDPARIGEELGADAVVDGTVQLARDRVRISARLVETDSGVQRWTERFDGAFEDVFTLQESMGKRIAESLRLEIDAAAHRRTAPQEAIELYLRARKVLRMDVAVRGEEAIEMLDRCLSLAPTFTPAFPVHAMASVRAWWGQQQEHAGAKADRAKESVARACREAPDVAETHLVRAMLAAQDGGFREAAQSLAKALDIAPTLAEAHHYLGEIQIEAARLREGKRRVELALELDPTLARCHISLARVAAFDDDYARCDHHLSALAEASNGLNIPLALGRVRFALWRGDREGARQHIQALGGIPSEGPQAMMQLLLVATGENSVPVAREIRQTLQSWLGNPRFTALVQQITTEIFAFAGEHEDALEILSEAADGVLCDIEWVHRCPLLKPLAAYPEFRAAEKKIADRALSIWQR